MAHPARRSPSPWRAVGSRSRKSVSENETTRKAPTRPANRAWAVSGGAVSGGRAGAALPPQGRSLFEYGFRITRTSGWLFRDCTSTVHYDAGE